MQGEVIHEEKGYTVEAVQDELPENPLEAFDQTAIFVCFHPRYDLSSPQKRIDEAGIPNSSPDALLEWLDSKEGKKAVVLPLVLLDHSGLWLKVGNSFHEDPGGWDTSRVGVVVVTRPQFNKYCGGRWTRKRAEEVARQDAQVFGAYVEGDVYGWVVKNEAGETVDSCWGYYGFDENKKYMVECGHHAIEADRERRAAEHREARACARLNIATVEA